MQTAEKARPIIMSGPSVRAIQERRKRMTRRVVKPQPPADEERGWVSPYAPGQLLYVKEAWAVKRFEPCEEHEWDYQELLGPTIRYLADGEERRIQGSRKTGEGIYRGVVEKARFPLFMPRWASRITLRVTAVRVERVQDISEADAVAEGMEKYHEGWMWVCNNAEAWASARGAYRNFWDYLHAKPKPKRSRGVITHYESYPWDDVTETREHRGKPWEVRGNPWVRVTEFEPCR